ADSQLGTNTNNNNNNSSDKLIIESTTGQRTAEAYLKESEFTLQSACQNATLSNNFRSNNCSTSNTHKSNDNEKISEKNYMDCINVTCVSKENVVSGALEQDFLHQQNKSYQEINGKKKSKIATRQMSSQRSLSSAIHSDESNSSGASNESEEIDLTTNTGCIDYSYSNENKN
ncbi:anaphase-promoting complex subunit cdh1-like, partial [Anopheles nili]|uniref:anaphase-promoting complex subunit cdh1-like n=1 Tax=Anopheles nili TaxID=185578 RepID=UPI00237BED6F